MDKSKLTLAKPREEVVSFIKEQFIGNEEVEKRKYNAVHYGKVELRDLLDFIYDEEPTKPSEKL